MSEENRLIAKLGRLWRGAYYAEAAEAFRAPAGCIAIALDVAGGLQLAKLERMGFTETDIETPTATLTERYPNTFAQFRRPLAIGIHTAIIADLGCDPVLLRLVLARWTNSAGTKLRFPTAAVLPLEFGPVRSWGLGLERHEDVGGWWRHG
jgi:hypothetical protein